MTEHPLANYPRPPPGSEDLPYDDGEPMETQRHRMQMNVLIDTLEGARDGNREFFCGGNMFVYFSETQAKKNDFRGPDVFVALGRPQQDVKSYVAWEQNGQLPDIVVELLSPKTEHVDRGEKFRIYRDIWKVQRYYLFDPYTFVMEGYALVDGAYVPIERDAHGRLECAPLGLSLGIQETVVQQIHLQLLRWFDADGAVLPTEREHRLRSEAELEDLGRAAEQHIARADEEKARADEEKARADEEKARADEEKARADALARRIAELEAERDA